MLSRDTMKVHLLALLLVIGAAVAVPAVSATIVEEKEGYIVMTGPDTLNVDSLNLRDMSRLSRSSISQGQSQWYATSVSSGNTAFYSGLNWGNPSNSLALTIYAPDSLFGPYYDNVDGVIDGQINVQVIRNGSLTSGTWRSEVYGQSVTGSQSYTYSAYPV